MDSLPAKLGIASLVLLLALSCIMVPQFRAANPQSADMLVQVMGGTAELAGNQAYQEADVYFHAGTQMKCTHEGGSAKCEENDCHQLRNSEMDYLPFHSWFQRMQASSAPQIHRHLAGAENKEILPWFVVSTRLNPHLVEAWSTGTYWFYRTGDVKRSEQFVCDGIRNNPTDYRLYFDRGVLYYHLQQWDKAVRDLHTAHRLWKNLDEDSPLDLQAIRRYTGYAQTHRTVRKG